MPDTAVPNHPAATAPAAEIDEVQEALQRLVDVADRYGEGPNQDIRDAYEYARKVLAKASAKVSAQKAGKDKGK